MIPTVDHLKAVHKHIQSTYPQSVCRGHMNCGKMQLIMEKPFREVYGHKKYDTVYLQGAIKSRTPAEAAGIATEGRDKWKTPIRNSSLRLVAADPGV